MNIAKAPGICMDNISTLKLPDVFIEYVCLICGIYKKQVSTPDIVSNIFPYTIFLSLSYFAIIEPTIMRIIVRIVYAIIVLL